MSCRWGRAPPVARLSGVGGSAAVIGSALAVGLRRRLGVGGRAGVGDGSAVGSAVGSRVGSAVGSVVGVGSGLDSVAGGTTGPAAAAGDRGDEHEGGEQQVGDPTAHEHSGSGLGHGASIDAMIGLVRP